MVVSKLVLRGNCSKACTNLPEAIVSLLCWEGCTLMTRSSTPQKGSMSTTIASSEMGSINHPCDGPLD